MDTDNKKEMSFKEDRIRKITSLYYSLPHIKKALYDFSKNRECIPRYFEGFGKRPDVFHYESDTIEFVKKGATSFHCSEEIWENPQDISTEMSRKDFNELRIGWDLLLDIDSPYLEYSKIYAEILIDTLKFHGIKNIGVKFSGSKGFHVIIPWKAFPKQVYNQNTKDMFPEWPRIICQYLGELIQPKLTERILKDETLSQIARKTGREEKDLVIRECKNCRRPATTKFVINWLCSYCKNQITTIEGMYNNRRKPKCPECRKELIENSKKEIFACDFCRIDSRKNPDMFESKERIATEKLIDADLVLVAPRHLFRMPYSLHEKTSLSSVVIDKDEIKDFDIHKAMPLKVKVFDFYPDSKPEEAKELLLQSLEWHEQNEKREKDTKKTFSEISNTTNNQQTPSENKPKEFQKIIISNPTKDIYPPCISLLLNGVKQDGRKRALFILINYFKSLGVNDIELEKRIDEWNEKNYQPLKKGYIQSQLIWFKRNQAMLPPNCDKPSYKDLGICKPDEFCRFIKNPVNYSVKKYLKSKR